MTDLITLRDTDNRNDDGSAYEFTGPPAQIAGYLDGPLRSDLRPGTTVDVNAAIAAVTTGDLDSANQILNRFAGVYLTLAG